MASPFRPKTVEDILAHTVLTPTGCREWQGGRTKDGYGTTVDGKGGRTTAHRLVWLLLHPGEPEPPHVRHTCNNPPCCEPTHLLGGTVADNVHDTMRSGNFTAPGLLTRGSQRPNAKLNDQQVIDIRRRAAEGERQTDLAAEMGVAPSTVNNIVAGRQWRHLLEEAR